ncbi:probable ascorbate-specific transmembrane electron transporter 1 [Chenopodium quinoa]|uniref:probable ascorbate-specific transmembrane electron transporter 1 n=1 Tax=Chenopodium quinoa TaxID=63459 RepID=UPI000B76BC28|nr:probable ascorbate-specific transmembrane electron transporter 1 [Chenopodium quinoa]
MAITRASSRLATMFAHLLAVAMTTLVLVWLLHFREGLAFRSHIKPQIFNIHPLLMIIGVIEIGGEAIMAYKTIPGAKRTQKKVHLMLHLVALITGIVGIYAVFKFHKELSIPHLYTFHSWLGISTICLYGLQWILSFITFAFPHSKSTARAAVAPWHVFGGIVIFLLAICTAVMGLVEKFTFLKLQRTQEALVVNFTGLMIILFSIMVGLVVTFPRL